METAKVPIIDAGGWLSRENTSPPPAHLVKQIGDACQNWGLFVLINHGIPDDAITTVFAAAQQFMALPLEEKLKIKRNPTNARGFFNDELTKQTLDHKECFDYGFVPHPDLPEDHPSNVSPIEGYNRWPSALPQFREVMHEHFAECQRAAFRLLEVMACALGLNSSALHRFFLPDHSGFCRVNYYPAEPDAPPGTFGVHHHTDAGALTLLLQDAVAGLEVMHEGVWHLVQPSPGALTGNVGDQLQVLSNDRFIAPLHRVRASRQQSRFSIPFFFNPSPSAVIEPLPELVGTGTAHYSSIPWAEFRYKRFLGDYADVGEEVQISHYKKPSAENGAAAVAV